MLPWPSALHSSPVSGISYKNVDIQYISQVGFFWSVTKLIFSRYIFNSFPFIAPPRQKINASNHFLPQQNGCGNLKYCRMSGQVTAWSLSFSLKWNNYPFVCGTNSTTKRSLGCASTNGGESWAPATLPTTTSILRLLHADTAIHLNLAITNAPPTANEGNARPSLIATDKDKSDSNGCNRWLSPPWGDTSAAVVPVRSGVRECLVTG